MLTLYRRLIALRRREPALTVGEYMPVTESGDVIAYLRSKGNDRFLVALNLGPEPETFNLTRPGTRGRLLLSTHLDRYGDELRDKVELRGDEGLIIKLF